MSDDLKTNYTKLNKRYQEIKRKLAESNESHHKNIVELTKIATEKDRKIEKLKQQLAITEKALELACETLQDINFKLYNTEMNFVDFFKQQAKEMLENE